MKKKLQRRLASRLDRWVSLMRMHGGAQAEMIASAPEEIRDLFSKTYQVDGPVIKSLERCAEGRKTLSIFRALFTRRL